jgi:hypothetical protein
MKINNKKITICNTCQNSLSIGLKQTQCKYMYDLLNNFRIESKIILKLNKNQLYIDSEKVCSKYKKRIERDVIE